MTKKMYIIAAVFIILVSFIAVRNIRAQVHVESASYDLMLSTLLSHSVKEISVDEADTSANATFIDAREKNEFEVSHIKNAIWVGYDDFDVSRLCCIDKNVQVIVYCSVGYRSEKITEKLKALGYTNVANMYGGIFEWVNAGYPVVDMNGATTSKVHAYSKTWGTWLTRGEKIYE